LDIPHPEHGPLEQLAGEWQFERQSVPADGSSPRTLGTGVITAEMVGGFFVVSRWSGNLYGVTYEALQSPVGAHDTHGSRTGRAERRGFACRRPGR
jgi:hypothetical protein